MLNKRIEDYNKTLPILEVYRCVQSEGSRFGRPTILLELQAVPIDVILEKAVGVIAGIPVSILRRGAIYGETFIRYMMIIHTSKK